MAIRILQNFTLYKISRLCPAEEFFRYNKIILKFLIRRIYIANISVLVKNTAHYAVFSLNNPYDSSPMMVPVTS